MGFWISMLFVVMLTPAIMLIFGKIFIKSAPKEINDLYGYRTTMSMKNQDTWEFAHNCIGKLWYKSGLPIIVISIVIMIVSFGKSVDVIGKFVMVIMVVQFVGLIGPMFVTEKELKKNFDKDGNRKQS